MHQYYTNNNPWQKTWAFDTSYWKWHLVYATTMNLPLWLAAKSRFTWSATRSSMTGHARIACRSLQHADSSHANTSSLYVMETSQLTSWWHLLFFLHKQQKESLLCFKCARTTLLWSSRSCCVEQYEERNETKETNVCLLTLFRDITFP